MTTGTETSIVRVDTPRSDMALMPVMSIDQAIARYNTVIEFAKRVMAPGKDYGVIPGTQKKTRPGEAPSNDANTLLKPGAEKLCSLFGFVPDFQDYRIIEDWENGLFYYAFRCVLSRGGQPVASCIGSANSREKKYRRGTRTCPECGAATIKRSKYPPKGQPDATPGWYCEERSGGCGRSFAADDTSILEQTAKADPMEAADLLNTLQKMAQKRALVGAALLATNASEFFTQDVDDMDFIDVDRQDPKAKRTTTDQDSQLPDWEQFLEAWILEAKQHGFDNRSAVNLWDGICKKRNVTMETATAEMQKEALAALHAGKFDKLIKPNGNGSHSPLPPADSTPAGASETTTTAPAQDSAQEARKEAPTGNGAPPAAPVDKSADKEGAINAALKKPWPEVKELLRGKAKDHGLNSRADFESGIVRWVLATGKKGAEDTIDPKLKRALYDAVCANKFDWELGRIRP